MDTAALLIPAALVACAYLLGSIPFGLLMSRMMGMADPRTTGSGNIGATNVLRGGSKTAAALTLLLDAAKGSCAVALAPIIMDAANAAPATTAITGAAAIAAVIGHCFPVWLGFRGGKGVATGIGTLLALNPVSGLLVILVWIGMAAVTRISSLAALAGFAIAPIALFAFAPPQSALAGFIIAAIIFLRHRGNIARLRRGNEPRIGSPK